MLIEQSPKEEPEELILDAVRGRIPWSVLEKFGITMDIRGVLPNRIYHIDNPRRLVAVAEMKDIAEGLLKFCDSPRVVAEWASIVLAGSTFIDFADEVEMHPYGDEIIDALWDAAFEGKVTPRSIEIAKEIMSSQQSDNR